MALVLAGPETRYAFAVGGALFAVAAVTDFFDGFLARRWAQVSAFGNFLDTTADKLLVSGALLALVAVDRASPWIALVIVGRELMILGLKGAVAAGGRLVQPSIWGKAKANVQFLAIFLAIVRYPRRAGSPVPRRVPDDRRGGHHGRLRRSSTSFGSATRSRRARRPRDRGRVTGERVLVTGGSGLVGGALVRGWSATGERRRPRAQRTRAAPSRRWARPSREATSSTSRR